MSENGKMAVEEMKRKKKKVTTANRSKVDEEKGRKERRN